MCSFRVQPPRNKNIHADEYDSKENELATAAEKCMCPGLKGTPHSAGVRALILRKQMRTKLRTLSQKIFNCRRKARRERKRGGGGVKLECTAQPAYIPGCIQRLLTQQLVCVAGWVHECVCASISTLPVP